MFTVLPGSAPGFEGMRTPSTSIIMYDTANEAAFAPTLLRT